MCRSAVQYLASGVRVRASFVSYSQWGRAEQRKALLGRTQERECRSRKRRGEKKDLTTIRERERWCLFQMAVLLFLLIARPDFRCGIKHQSKISHSFAVEKEASSNPKEIPRSLLLLLAPSPGARRRGTSSNDLTQAELSAEASRVVALVAMQKLAQQL